tara:strand:- start:566 stop:694 length:129 start_codon:yes stop_codon:yes gene_type:complete
LNVKQPSSLIPLLVALASVTRKKYPNPAINAKFNKGLTPDKK